MWKKWFGWWKSGEKTKSKWEVKVENDEKCCGDLKNRSEIGLEIEVKMWCEQKLKWKEMSTKEVWKGVLRKRSWEIVRKCEFVFLEREVHS